jgi:hypothetical protein
VVAAAVGVVVLLAVLAVAGRHGQAAEESGHMIVHDVYFTLKDSSAEARHKLVAACRKYLTKHPGEVFFAVGTMAEEFKREVNDRDWDVGLHIVFKDKATHDQYQESQRHKEFVAENHDSFKKVRVFDTLAER